MSQYQCKICRTMHSHRDECPFQQDALASSTVQYVTKMSRPTGSNADEWALFLSEHNGATEYIAVQIAEALERALADGAAMRAVVEAARELAKRAERQIYPQPDKPNSDYAVLRRLQDALAALDGTEAEDG